MSYTTFNCDALTGGGTRALDTLVVGDLTTGDRAVVYVSAKTYFFKYTSTATAAEQATTAPRVIRPDNYSTGGNWDEYPGEAATSVLAQVQHAVVTAVVSGTTIMPIDDTIPQNTEGFEVITCAITPKSETNLLVIIAETIYGSYTPNACHLAMALFQDTTAAALAAVTCGSHASYGCKTLTHKMVAGTTSATTFKIRFGSNAANTITLNSVPEASGRVFGGVASTTLTIFEYTP